MSDIYDQHSRAFARVSAYVIMNGADRVGTVAIKFPADGAGRLYAYVHIHGAPMVRGWAGGGGYDKRSAAVASALERHEAPDYGVTAEQWEALQRAIVAMRSRGWIRAIEDATGWRVWQAV